MRYKNVTDRSICSFADNGRKKIIVDTVTALDEDDILRYAKDCELFGEIEAVYEWYDIGVGESGLDTFFEEDALIQMYGQDGIHFEKRCKEQGYDAYRVEYGTIFVTVDDH